MHSKVSKTGTKIYVYESTDEMLGNLHANKFNEESESWVGKTGLVDLPKTIQAVQSVWPEGIQTLEKLTQRVKNGIDIPEIKSKKRKTRFSDTDGDELDLDRLRSGQAYWRTSQRQDTPGIATVTILIDVGTIADVTPEDALWRGAVAIALATILEEKGYRTELWATACGKRYEKKEDLLVEAVCLKKPGDPLDVSTLINTVSAWVYRTIWLTLHSSLAVDEKFELRSCYGTSRPMREADIEAISTDKNRIYIANTFSEDHAISMVRKELEKFKH